MPYFRSTSAARRRAEKIRAAEAREARAFIASVGEAEARRVSDREISRACCEANYSFGRIGFYSAVRDELDARVEASA